MKDDFRVFLLAYPDNPVGRAFLRTFVEGQVSIGGVVVERKSTKNNWRRFKKKIEKDGFVTAVRRFLQVFALRLGRQNIVGLAEKHGIRVYWVDKFNSQACADLLASLRVDLLAIVSAPILKDYVFEKAKKGCLNAHPGWLPKYRGVGANAYALQNGDAPGVTVHFIDAGIDTGRIIVREKIPVRRGDAVARINDRATVRGAELMVDVIHRIRGGRLVMPRIDEPPGELYRAMPYSVVKEVNKKLKKIGESDAF